MGHESDTHVSGGRERDLSKPYIQRTAQWKNSELILTFEMETRHPVEGPFGSEFPAIYNHCGVMTA